MIIKKSTFNLHKKWRGNWPFTVNEVAVVHMDIGGQTGFSICHKYKLYAVTGIFENYLFNSIEASGIWADNPEISGTKKSLSSFFQFCQWHSKEVLPCL